MIWGCYYQYKACEQWKKGKHQAHQKVYKRALHLLPCLSLRKWHGYDSVQLLVVIQEDRCLFVKVIEYTPDHLRYQDHQ